MSAAFKIKSDRCEARRKPHRFPGDPSPAPLRSAAVPDVDDYRLPMPPTMVDLRPPTPNPSKGQIFTSAAPPPPLFNQTGIPPRMDPADLRFPPPSGKPSGLSKPRLVKVRRQFASTRVRQSRDQNGGGAPTAAGFNPFSSNLQRSGNLDSLNSQSSSSSGFVFGAGSASSSDPKNFVSGERNGVPPMGTFSIGSSVKKSSNLSRSSAEEKIFVFGSGAKGSSNLSWDSSVSSDEGSSFQLPDEMRKLNLQSADDKNSRKNAPNVGFGNSNEGFFLFGSGVKNGSGLRESSSIGSDKGLFSEIPDELWKMKLQSGSNERPEETMQADNCAMGEDNNFVFEGGSNMPNDETQNPDPGVFVFGSGVECTSDSSRNLPLGSDRHSFSILPDEMGKLNSQNAGEPDAFAESKQAECRPQMHKIGAAVFEGSKNTQGEGPGNSEQDFFVFGSRSDKLASSRGRGFLPDGSPSGEPNPFKFTFQAGKRENKLPGEMNNLSTGRETANQNKGDERVDFVAGVFAFANSSKTSPVSSQTSTASRAGLVKDTVSDLLDGIKKSDTQGSRNDFGFKNTEESDFVHKVNLGPGLVFGSSNNAFAFSGGADENTLPDDTGKLNHGSRSDNLASSRERGFLPDGSPSGEPNPFKFTFQAGKLENKLPGEMNNLSTGRETANQNKGDEREDFVAGVFAFGTSSKTSSVSSQTSTASRASSVKDTASDLSDGIKKSDIQGSWNDFVFKNTEESDFVHKVNLGPGLVFGCSNNAAPFSGGTNENTLPDDTKILNHGSRSDNLVSSREQDFLPDGSPDGEPNPLKFTFQAQKREQDSSTGPTPQFHIHENVRPSSVASPSVCPLTSGQSAGTAFPFRNMHEGLQPPQVEPFTEKKDTFCFSKEKFSSGLRQSMSCSKSRDAKCTKTMKKRGKSRKSAPVNKQFISREKLSPENSELEQPDDYSPMDYSPYRENSVCDQFSRETSTASHDSIHLASHYASTDSHVSSSKGGRAEDTATSMDGKEDYRFFTTQHMGINDGDLKHGGLDGDGFKDRSERNFAAKFSFVDKQTCVPENGNRPSEYGNVGLDKDRRTVPIEADTDTFSTNIVREADEGGAMYTFHSSLEDHTKSNSTVAGSTTEQGSLSEQKYRYRRKWRPRTGRDSYNSTRSAKNAMASSSPNLFPVSSDSVHHSPPQSTSGIPFCLKTENENIEEKNRKPEASQESRTTATSGLAAQEACEKWRIRGNKAYANGFLSKAEDYYTRGVNSASLNDTSGSCIRALMLCYSNRAAARMSLGRMREAISDCMIALANDPNFLRARVRAANCHLALGETEDAMNHFKKCLQSENVENCDQKIVLEAYEGLKKAQHVADCINQSVEILLKRTNNDATKALRIISEALSVSPHAESLMEMKAEALLMLRNYEEVIKMCEQTLDLAEKNSVTVSENGQPEDVNSSNNQRISSERVWRWHFMSKSYFYQRKFDEALELLQKHEKAKHMAYKYWNKSEKYSTSLAVIIRKLLRLKVAGNEAFQAGRHLEAVEYYTSALSCSTESRPFTAICFCNRAAAYQALSQITDAIADCSLAIALDSSYSKAISRRATLHEMIRDYGQVANDLNMLISLIENQTKNKDNISGTTIRSTSNHSDLKHIRARLTTAEKEARKATSLDMYMILGIEPTSSAADVKKAYRKAALRHHPDKAGHFLTRSENINDGLWREVASDVHADADRLFKMIGEAYAILSDPTKRLAYDEEEEIRATIRNVYSGSCTHKTQTDSYGREYERNANRRHWRSYGSSYQG